MSKAALLELAKEAKKLLAESEKSRTETYNKQPHSYSVSRLKIMQEALVQIGRTRESITDDEMSQLTEAATNYCNRLHDAFKTEQERSPSTIQLYAKSRVNFYVVIQDSGNAYKKIYTVRVSADGGLRKFTNDLHRIFPESRKVHTVAFDVGHQAGHSISEKRIQAALTKFSSIPKVSGQGARAINSVISLAIRSEEKVAGSKSIYIEVKDESAVENQRKGREEEKTWIRDTRAALDNLIKKVDWANQRGSRSAVEAAISELLLQGRKSGAKVKGKISTKSSSSKVTDKIITEGKTPTEIQTPLVGDISLPGKESKTTNWSALVRIINAKLPDKVRSNMGSPALNNRTGTLASSARVLTVENTKEGFPSIVFDYERNPYNVFDRTVGRAPWNTPQRDPRTLVDRSIREIVQQMAIGRFYTRRA